MFAYIEPSISISKSYYLFVHALISLFFRWTREEPQPLILKRIIALAKASAALIEQHISSLVPLNLKVFIFLSPVDVTNVMINSMQPFPSS